MLVLVACGRAAYDDGKEGKKTDMDEAGVLAATMNQPEVQGDGAAELEKAIRRARLARTAQTSAHFLASSEQDQQPALETDDRYTLSSGAANFLSIIIPNRPHDRIFSQEEIQGLVQGLLTLRGPMRARVKSNSLDYEAALRGLFSPGGMTFKEIATEILGNSTQSTYNSLNNFAYRCADNARAQKSPIVTVEDLIRLGGVDVAPAEQIDRPALPAVEQKIPQTKSHAMASIAMGPVFAPEPPMPAINNPYDFEESTVPKPRDTGDDDLLSWQDGALCAQTDPEVFFPEKGGSPRDAKKICASCDVRSECLEYALVTNERFGVWGGLSERERRKLKLRAK